VNHEADAVSESAADGIQDMEIFSVLGIESMQTCRGAEADCYGLTAAKVKPVQSGLDVRVGNAVDPGPYLYDVSAAQIPLKRSSRDETVDLCRRRNPTLAEEKCENFGDHPRIVSQALR
jgi:hypothetical protein